MPDAKIPYIQFKVARTEEKRKKLEKELALLSKRERKCWKCYGLVVNQELSDDKYKIEVLHAIRVKDGKETGGRPQELCPECKREHDLEQDAKRKREAYYKEKQEHEDCIHRGNCEYGVEGCEYCVDYESPV